MPLYRAYKTFLAMLLHCSTYVPNKKEKLVQTYAISSLYQITLTLG